MYEKPQHFDYTDESLHCQHDRVGLLMKGEGFCVREGTIGFPQYIAPKWDIVQVVVWVVSNNPYKISHCKLNALPPMGYCVQVVMWVISDNPYKISIGSSALWEDHGIFSGSV